MSDSQERAIRIDFILVGIIARGPDTKSLYDKKCSKTVEPFQVNQFERTITSQNPLQQIIEDYALDLPRNDSRRSYFSSYYIKFIKGLLGEDLAKDLAGGLLLKPTPNDFLFV